MTTKATTPPMIPPAIGPTLIVATALPPYEYFIEVLKSEYSYWHSLEEVAQSPFVLQHPKEQPLELALH